MKKSYLPKTTAPRLFFSDYFEVAESKLERYGAFNISLVTDLPLFIDPFLLFNSRKRKYQVLHRRIIDYLRFLRDKSTSQVISPGLLRSWYHFPEVEQNWFGFTASGNKGRGLGPEFAKALNQNLQNLFSDFGAEQITRGSHLEKLCLIKDKVGKDTISDFATNLIKDFLLEYTETFAKRYIKRKHLRRFRIAKVKFNFRTETWEEHSYTLPSFDNNYVILTPDDLLTKDDTWINKTDLVDDFSRIPDAIPDEQLRAQIDNYFRSILPRKPKEKEELEAKRKVYLKFPQLIDYFIKYKEDHGKEAEKRSIKVVGESKQLYINQFGQLSQLLATESSFYKHGTSTEDDVRLRLEFLKHVIEDKGGHKLFYLKRKPISNEEDLHILYALTWFGTSASVTREANDGRGPVDFKVSRGSVDTIIVEMKLASNSQLKRNLQHQTEVYKKASDAKITFKVILFFTQEQEKRVRKILKMLNMNDDRYVVLINARLDNKPSGSKA